MENTKGKQHVVIVHGYTASPDENWFPWMKRELEKEGVQVSVPAMPNPMTPDPIAWVDTLWREVPQVDENTHFVGHSLGCITALLYLSEKHPGNKVGSLTMVSGFAETTSTLPELAAFTEPKLSLDFAHNITPNRVVVASNNDTIVPIQYSQKMAKEMEAEFARLPTGGHFLAREGYEEFPLLLKMVNSVLH